jgi:hypothetical protein
MNSDLRGAIYRKHMLYTQYTKQRNAKTWEKFRQQRNLVTKLKKKSMAYYFLERCSGGSKTCNFWTTIKPFFSKKNVTLVNRKLTFVKTIKSQMKQRKFQKTLTLFFSRL